MDKNNIQEITSLIDNYGVLLSNKKKKYIECHYFQDLTLSEIATINEISRAAVHQAINEGITEMREYENKLKYIFKQKQRIDFYNKKIKDKELIEELIDLEYGKQTC
ncbi:MAG: sigma factor-like helix-turn-helix DNA-binding protein [Mycoplasma sp.]